MLQSRDNVTVIDVQFMAIACLEFTIHTAQRKETGRMSVEVIIEFLTNYLKHFFFFFRLLPFRGRHNGCFQASAQKIWQCFTPNALPDATYW